MGYRLSLCQEWGISQNPPIFYVGIGKIIAKYRK